MKRRKMQARLKARQDAYDATLLGQKGYRRPGSLKKSAQPGDTKGGGKRR